MGLLDNLLQETFEVLDGIVTETDEAAGTCSVNIAPEDKEATVLPDVSLRSVADGEKSGVVCIPAVGSAVVFVRVEGQADYVLIKTSKLDKVIVNCDKVVFNEGLNKGMVKIAELEKNLDSLKTFVEQMNNTLPAAFTAVGIGAAANGGTASANYTAAMGAAKITFSDMENKEVTH